MTDAALMRMMTQDGPGEAEVGHLEKLEADAIVIAGGAWSRNVLRLLGLKDYSEPIGGRSASLTIARPTSRAYGMIVDTTGLYFHNEGPHILAGYSPPEAPGYHFNYDGEEFFHKEIWPRMSMRECRDASGCATSPDGPACTKSRPIAAPSSGSRRRRSTRRIRSAVAA